LLFLEEIDCVSYYQEIGSEALDYLLSFSYVPNTREASFGMSSRRIQIFEWAVVNIYLLFVSHRILESVPVEAQDDIPTYSHSVPFADKFFVSVQRTLS